MNVQEKCMRPPLVLQHPLSALHVYCLYTVGCTTLWVFKLHLAQILDLEANNGEIHRYS